MGNPSSMATAVILFGALIVSALVAFELKAWFEGRADDPQKARRATRRMIRRIGGAALLLVVLGLLLLPPTDSAILRLVRLLACLSLSVVALLVALYDFRIMRHEMRLEIHDFVQSSATAFQDHLQDLARQNPELAEKIPDILGSGQRKSAKPSRE
jgi:hypothetical protein